MSLKFSLFEVMLIIVPLLRASARDRIEFQICRLLFCQKDPFGRLFPEYCLEVPTSLNFCEFYNVGIPKFLNTLLQKDENLPWFYFYTICNLCLCHFFELMIILEQILFVSFWLFKNHNCCDLIYISKFNSFERVIIL